LLSCAVLGTQAAPAGGTLVLRLRSDWPQPGVWGLVTVDYTFAGEAAPSLQWTPNFVETGVATSNSVSEQITLSNPGFADLLGVRLALVTTNGKPAPNWVFLNSATNLGTLAMGGTRPVSLAFSPGETVPLSGTTPYLFYLRVTADNHPTRDIPLYVNVDRSGLGNALFKVMDIYTGTLDGGGNLIQGLAGARIRLVKEEGSTYETNLVTDAIGEALAQTIPVGRYTVRVSANGHNDRSDTLWINPGMTVTRDCTLESQLVTVEWSVRETTVQDRYEIVLNATYQTDVPAPVVVIEPASLSLPDMAPGDVLNGEFTIRNYGLIRAEDVNLTLPASDTYYKYETLGAVPATLEAKQVLRVPYRVTCLSSLAGDQQSGGGGCRTYSACIMVCYRYRCSNGTTFTSCSPSFCIFRMDGECSGGGSAGGPGGGNWTSGASGGTGAGTPTARPQSLGGVVCWPEAVWKEVWFDDDSTGLLETLQNILVLVGCSVNCVNRTFMDESTDLSVKVRGGRLEAKRQFLGNAWAWTDNRRLQGAAEFLASQPPILNRCYCTQYFHCLPCFRYEMLPIFRPFNHCWNPEPSDPIAAQYKHETYTLTLYRGWSEYYWWLEDKRGNWEHYLADGRLHRRGNKRGITAYYAHGFDGGTPVTWVYDQSPRLAFTYEYDGNGQIKAVYDRTGRRVEYRYTGDRLTEVLDANGKSTLYEYDSAGRMTRKVDAGGRPTLATYDAQGNVTSAVDRNGNGQFFAFNYDANKQSRYAQVRTSSGMVKEVWYDDEGETSRVDINGRTVQSIAKNGRNLTITDEKGNVTRKDRDAWDNVTSIVYPDNSSVSYAYEYRFNQPTRFVDQKGVTHLFEYDTCGNLVRKVEAAGTSAERITQYVYDFWGQLTWATTVADANTEACTNRFAYDTWGNLTYTVNPMGETNRFLAYDAIGNPLAIQDARSNVWYCAYDPLGRLTSVTDPSTNVTTYAYDGANNRTNVVNPYLKSFGFEYDDHNNLVRAVDPLSTAQRYQYNTDNLPTRQTDPEGNELATVYDNEGRVLRGVDGATNQIVYRYDETAATPASSYLPVRIEYPSFTRNLYYNNMQRLLREEDALGGGTNYSRTYTYDLGGNVLSATDAEAHTNRFEYDALNRLVKTTDAVGGITRRTFDDRGNVIAVEDPNGGITRYQYDRNNRLTRMTRPMGQETVYGYDTAGNCTSIIDAKGKKIVNEYDAVNRLMRRLHFAATDHTNAVKTITFSYNALGNLLAWDDGTNSAQFTYDALQRKTSESVSYGAFTLSYSNTYYANGLKKTFTGPDGITYGYAYDVNNRLSAVSVPGNGTVTWDSYSWNSPTRTTQPGGGSTDFTYDSLMRPKSITARDSSLAVGMSRNYQYSPAGNILAKGTEHGDYTYRYDDLYRLTTASNAVSASEAYAYDALGNRTNSASVSGPWIHNQNNELLGHSNVTFTYDASGNMTRKVKGAQTVNYFYDVANRLVRVEDGGGAVIAGYGYDPFLRRLWKEVGGVKTCFFYSEEGLIGEYDSSGAETKTYGYRPGSLWSTAPLFQKTGGTYYWYQNDHLGTPQKLVDSNGHVVWAGTYDSFGNCQINVAEIENNRRFPGQYWDGETGLHYNWNRYYEPTTGRYLQRDSIEALIDTYGYAAGNPLVYVDPDGRCALRDIGIGLIEGAWETGWETGAALDDLQDIFGYYTGWWGDDRFDPRSKIGEMAVAGHGTWEILGSMVAGTVKSPFEMLDALAKGRFRDAGKAGFDVLMLARDAGSIAKRWNAGTKINFYATERGIMTSRQYWRQPTVLAREGFDVLTVFPSPNVQGDSRRDRGSGLPVGTRIRGDMAR
jgi:RHS repeat-associated protein